MLSVVSRNHYDPRKDRAPDNTSPEWVSGQAYLASRDDKYRPRNDAERAMTRVESLIREGLDFVSVRDAGNAKVCYSFASRLARQAGSDDIRKSLLELDSAISGLN